MKKWEKEIHEQLRQDDATLKKAASGFAANKKTLEGICSQAISTRSTDQLATLFAELEEASMLPLKYGCYSRSRLDEASPGLAGRLNMISQLDTMLYNAFEYAISDLGNQWKNAKKHFKSWKTEYGFDELKKERANLNSVADTYDHLLNGFGGELAPNNIPEIENYLRFVDTIALLDAKYAQFKKNYHPKDNTPKEKLNIYQRDITDLKRDRLFTQNTIFEYKERLAEIDDCLAEIYTFLAPRPEIILLPQSLKETTPSPAELIAGTSVSPVRTIDLLAEQPNQAPEQPIPAQYQPNPQQAQEEAYTYAAPDTTPNERSSYRPIVRNQTNRFDMANHLLTIGFPSMAYMKLVDTLLGKVETQHEVKKLVPFTEQLKKLPAARNLQDMDYLYHMEYALREDLNHGSIDPLIANNRNYWQIAHTALSTLQEYIQRSEQALALDPNTIQAHLAITGQKNPYNRMLPTL
jgi:hypothetical protein